MQLWREHSRKRTSVFWELERLQRGNFSFFCLFRATPAAYGDSQARDLIWAIAAGLFHSSQQHWILNPLSEARDQNHEVAGPSRIRFRCTTTATPETFC